MSLGNCRHCQAKKIAADAPLCRECGGWHPNPGLGSRMNAATVAVVAAALVAAGGLLYLNNPGDNPALAGLLGFIGLSWLWRSIAYPYGKAPTM